jgi:hypothetical protein
VVAGVGDALPYRACELLDVPLALREHVDELGATTVAEGLADGGKRIEECLLAGRGDWWPPASGLPAQANV